DWPAPPDTAPPQASFPRQTNPRTPTAPATTSNAIVYDACCCFCSPPLQLLPDHRPAAFAIQPNSAPSRLRITRPLRALPPILLSLPIRPRGLFASALELNTPTRARRAASRFPLRRDRPGFRLCSSGPSERARRPSLPSAAFTTDFSNTASPGTPRP